MCMRASLENFGIFTFLHCYFFQYFVGTADTLSVQMTCLSAYMYRQFPNIPTNTNIEPVAAISCSEWGDGSSHLHLATLLVSESWQQ